MLARLLRCSNVGLWASVSPEGFFPAARTLRVSEASGLAFLDFRGLCREPRCACLSCALFGLGLDIGCRFSLSAFLIVRSRWPLRANLDSLKGLALFISFTAISAQCKRKPTDLEIQNGPGGLVGPITGMMRRVTTHSFSTHDLASFPMMRSGQFTPPFHS